MGTRSSAQRAGRHAEPRPGRHRRARAGIAEHRGRAARLPWLAAVLLVPLLLAGVTTVWRGPAIEHDLTDRSTAALAAAGLPGARVAFDGRDATIAGVPAGQQQRALSAVGSVEGVRTSRIRTGELPGAGAGAAGAEVERGGGAGRRGVRADGPMSPGPAAPAADREALRRALLAVPAITFRPDSVRLTPQGAASLRRVGELLLDAGGVPVEVAGHVAVAPGGPANARLLSERRAAVVCDALVAAGVPAASLLPRGYGDTRPKPGRRAASRRVEISIR